MAATAASAALTAREGKGDAAAEGDAKAAGSPNVVRWTQYKARDSVFSHPERMMFSNGSFIFACFLTVMFCARLVMEGHTDMTLFLSMTANAGFAVFIVMLAHGISSLVFVLWKLRVAGWLKKRSHMYIGYLLLHLLMWNWPVVMAFNIEFSPALNALISMVLVVDIMKVHSYFFVNLSLEANESREMPHHTTQFPANVTLLDFVRFWCMPTLCYEVDYPRTTRIRWRQVVLNAAGFVLCWVAFYIILDGAVLSQAKAIYNANIVVAIIKVGVPVASLWLLSFFAIWHCFLNMCAELTHYADRQFYREWWNATSFDQWWRSWNVPVHEWMLRHIFSPFVEKLNLRKIGAMILTFLVSAVLHEFVLTVTFRMIRPMLGVSMLLQIVLIWFTRIPILRSNYIGNFLIWVSHFIGMPLFFILYMRTYTDLYPDGATRVTYREFFAPLIQSVVDWF